MRAFVITIVDNHQSVEMSDRCIASCERYGLDVDPWPAVTPRNANFDKLQNELGLNGDNFVGKWSRKDNAIACFISMASLWKYSVESNVDVLILEHDAIMTGSLPSNFTFDKVCTLAKPSYGSYNTPTTIGTGRLVQKEYFKGAHGYIVSPEGAQILLDSIPTKAAPADVYLNTLNFPFLQEYYPWIFRADDSFSTIQNDAGCKAKHNYKKGIDIVSA